MTIGQKYTGSLITFEGIEGVGKSTQVKKICTYLQQQGKDFVATREPGGTIVAEDIRKILLNEYQEDITAETELLLLFAGRSQHLKHKIIPNLQAGKIVLCDRFTDSSFAYQGGGRGLDLKYLQSVENFVQGDLRPNLTIVLDTDNVAAALQRARGMGSGDRIEQEEQSFFERVRAAYLARAAEYPARYRIVNIDSSIDEVTQKIIEVLEQYFVTTAVV